MLTSSATRSPVTSTKHRYIPRGRNHLHTIFERHFDEFCDLYDEKYATTHGLFRLDRIRDIGGRFLTCGDYRLGVARVRCTNPGCGHDYFRPFSCKGFSLCPSCSQKRTLLFAEHLTNEVLLDLPHRQFVFTMPKAPRPFFRHDRRQFAEVSRLIYSIMTQFYAEAAGRALLSGLIVAHQSFGDQLRWNPHFHALVLEGGFDAEGTFVSIPFSGLEAMTCRSRRRLLRQFGMGRTAKPFRRHVINLLVDKQLLSQDFAENLLSWRHSGFSIDNSVRATDVRTQESLAQYISRPPVSLKKIRYEPFEGRVLFHTTYSQYFGRTPRVRRKTPTCSRVWTSWLSSPNISRRNAFSSSGATGSIRHGPRAAGTGCPMSPRERRRLGEHHTDLQPPRPIAALSLWMTAKR